LGAPSHFGKDQPSGKFVSNSVTSNGLEKSVKKLMIAAVSAGALVTFMPEIAAAQSRCPAGNTGCTLENAGSRIQDRYNETFRDVNRSQSPSLSGARRRVGEIKEGLEYCLNCGLDAARDGMSRITTPGATRR
jgi:hypothetical protein